MLKKIGLILVSVVLILSLCGCDFFKTDMAELFAPPSLTGDFKYISKIIEKTAIEQKIRVLTLLLLLIIFI